MIVQTERTQRPLFRPNLPSELDLLQGSAPLVLALAEGRANRSAHPLMDASPRKHGQ